jgi:FemAB-related protein (PEP-CTERM system-associated)
MVTVDVVNNSNEVKEEWDHFLEGSKNASFGSLFDWKILYEETFGFKTFYLSIKEDNKLIGILPLVLIKSPLIGKGSFLVSTPYVTQSGLCLNREQFDLLPLIYTLKKLIKDCRAKYVELRQLFPYPSDTLIMRKNFFTFHLDLSHGVEGLWKGFSSEVRNRIRKAQKSGVEVKTGQDIHFIKGFYKVFSKRMKELSFPNYPKDYMEAIMKIFYNRSRIVLVLFKGKVIGGMLVISFKNTLSMPYVASLVEYNHLCPNNLLYWEAIQQAIQGGHTIFDMGRSREGTGTFQFKKKLGAVPVQLYYQYLSPEGEKGDIKNLFDMEGSPLFNIYSSIWRRLPTPFTNLIGGYLIRQLYIA